MQVNSQFYDIQLSANQTYRQLTSGTMFKVVSATGPLNIRNEVANMKGMVSGQGMQSNAFTFLEVTDASGAANTVRLLVSGDGFIDGITGTMVITQTVPVRSSSFANTLNTVSNAGGLLLAANMARAYLLIQNKDPAGNLYIAFGAAATLANGIKIQPGGVFEMSDVQSTQAIYAISDIASNTNVLTVQG
jgi:hypothetical protein